MRLLLFNTDLELGGTPEVVRQLAWHLGERGHIVHVACLGRYGPVAQQIAAAGFDVSAFDLGVRDLPKAVGRLRRLASEARLDAVLSFLVHANAVAALAASKFHRRVRWYQSVQTTQPYPWWHWTVQTFAAKRARRVLCPSNSVANVAARRARVPREKLVVIPNGVDAVADALPARRDGPLRIAFLGRLDPVKRVGLLLDATAGIGGVETHVYGDGPERDRLASPHAIFHGMTPREAALSATDLLVLPSRAEGMPMVLLEAMAAGVPVVGFDVPGVRDVIRDGVNGVLLPEGGDLRAELVALRDDPERRQRLALAGLDDARTHRWETLVTKYEQALVA